MTEFQKERKKWNKKYGNEKRMNEVWINRRKYVGR